MAGKPAGKGKNSDLSLKNEALILLLLARKEDWNLKNPGWKK
jgi:hypothetical protein